MTPIEKARIILDDLCAHCKISCTPLCQLKQLDIGLEYCLIDGIDPIEASQRARLRVQSEMSRRIEKYDRYVFGEEERA